MKITLTPALFSLAGQPKPGPQTRISTAPRSLRHYMTLLACAISLLVTGCQSLENLPFPLGKTEAANDESPSYQKPGPTGESPVMASPDSGAQQQNTLNAPLALIDDYAGTRPIASANNPPPVNMGLGSDGRRMASQNLLTGSNFNDLWDRIRAGFRMDLTVDNNRVIAERDWYVKHGDYLLKVFERARPYLYHVVNELDRKQLPLELALLPVVESAYDPFAYSRSSAAGLWQFIPSTGASFKLKQNWWYDGRRDIALSTAAATEYLKRLNDMFHGDWELALAAYNAGGGTIRRAVAKNARRGKPTDYWSLNLSNETERYVPKLIALAQIIQNPTHFNVNPLPISNRPYFTLVETGGQIDLAKASEMSGVSLEEIYRLNPGFNRWASDPEGPHRLAVPVTQAERLRIGIANLPAHQRLTWRRYKVKQGDSLMRIAENFQTTASQIMQVNHLRTEHIRAGKQLLIPSRPSAGSQATAQTGTHSGTRAPALMLENQRRQASNNSSASGSMANAPERGLSGLPTQSQVTTRNDDSSNAEATAAGRKRLNYRVEPGDTLWGIAKKFDSSVAEIAKSNGMSPRDTLKVGQTLTIWLDSETAQDTRLALSSDLDGVDTGGPPQNTTRKVHYRVKNGDSLYRIADRFNLEVNDISRWNKLSDTEILKPGQQLVLYVDVRDTATR